MSLIENWRQTSALLIPGRLFIPVKIIRKVLSRSIPRNPYSKLPLESPSPFFFVKVAQFDAFRELSRSVVFAAAMGEPETFDAWKALLRKDCVALGKVKAFDGIGDVVLRILYENGVDPSVEAIVRDGLSGK